jgi:hypothetical protein
MAPSGAVVFFNLIACPSGWMQFAPAQGRSLVGASATGTVGGTVGTALGDLEDRAHSHLGADHAHSYSAISNTGRAALFGTELGNSNTGYFGGNFVEQTTADSTRGSQHTHPVSFVGTTSTTGGALPTGPARTSDSMPYLQLLACEKL